MRTVAGADLFWGRRRSVANHVQPNFFIARPACQIFCMWWILPPSKNIT